MIYTVTFNPAIDYVMKVDALTTGNTNRSEYEKIYFGGKGINVSNVLKELGMESTALGFCAGFTGDAILKNLEEKGIRADFVKLAEGNSRINVKIKGEQETEINGQGPHIKEDEINQLFEKTNRLKKGDILILAGSIPNTLPDHIYEEILEKLSGRGVRFVVDATQDLLVNVLKYRPFLIKPNQFELGEIFGRELETDEEIIECAAELKKQGAVNVLVSMAKKGAVLLDENDQVHKMTPPSGKAVNSVGAGDSMVAGFLAGYLKSGDYEYALKLGTAAGAATAFSSDLAKRDEIEKIINLL